MYYSSLCISSLTLISVLALSTFAEADSTADANSWWDSRWRMRITIASPTPYRNDAPRVVEAAIDFPLLLENAGVSGEFDPASLRVVERGNELPFAYRTEFDARKQCDQAYLTWFASPKVGQNGITDIYFDTKDQAIEAPDYDAKSLPPENLIENPSFEKGADRWSATPSELVSLGKFAHSTGKQSLKVAVDAETPKDVDRIVTVSQKIDVRKFAGQEIVFECDLMAERAAYGAPVTIELEQFREDGSRIPEYVVQSRWLSIELAQGQLVQFSERGQINPEAATVNVRARLRTTARDADTRKTLTGPESYITVWMDRFVFRPGERWPWPTLTNAGFVEGAMENAPLNRGFEFTGLRRLAFNGASEGTLTSGLYNPDPKSVHWGLVAGTLEFWCRPSWNADDGLEHVFFNGIAYGHRNQSRLRKLDSEGKNQLEFAIADADRTMRTVRGSAALKSGEWYHIAATWDFPAARLQLFVDGKKIAELGPDAVPWTSSVVAEGGEKKSKGIGIEENDTRSVPMQAFIGGDADWSENHAAEAVMDEFRISDVSRYKENFAPSRREFQIDGNTRALFHFENERDGVHDSDDRFVRGHLGSELPVQTEDAPLEILKDGKIDRQMFTVKPRGTDAEFEANRASSRMIVTRPFRELADPRFVEYRERQVEYTVRGMEDGLTVNAEGDLEPLMLSVTFQRADEDSTETTLLPRWRANDNVVPFSAADIAVTLGANAKNDAEKAHEVFNYTLQTTNYYDAHYCETLPTQHRPRVSYTLIKGLNIYPFDQCGPMNHMLRKLFLAAGISSTNASGTHHQFEQAFYDGGWRLFDLSSRMYWLERDNATVLSRSGMEDDLYLKMRQGGNPNAWFRGRRTRATFGSTERPHNMDFPLRPGESVSICWHNEGRWFELADDRKAIPLAKIPPSFGNGAIIYEPRAGGEATVMDNMELDGSATLRPKDSANSASLIYRAQCPYIFSDAQVSGNLSAQGQNDVKLLISFDEGKNWEEVWSNKDSNGQIAADLLQHVIARYAYWLKLTLAPNCNGKVTDLKVRTTFVASPLALPGKLSQGENRISFVGGPVSVPVKTTCRWVERHKSDLGVSLNSISYYMDGDQSHRNVFVAAPESECLVSVALQGKSSEGKISIEGLPEGWTSTQDKQNSEFALKPKNAAPGGIHGFDVVVQGERRIPAQVLVAEAPLVSEAEDADEMMGAAKATALPEASGGKVASFSGDGTLKFKLAGQQDGNYALWLRARLEPGSSTSITLQIDNTKMRKLRVQGMIGFTDWTDPNRAHTKMFAHFGEQYGHWSWYRIPDVALTKDSSNLTLGAKKGAQFDAIILLPQNPVMDRAAMNLFQNWNYAPWDNPF